MKIKILKTILSVFTLICVFTIGVYASSGLREVTAYVNHSLSIKLNGNDFKAYEEDGSELSPITYNDRTYLPVRAVADACGLAVDFDNETNTVLLGEKNGWVVFDGSNMQYDLAYKTDFTYDASSLLTAGQSFNSGFVWNSDYSTPLIVSFDTNEKYQKIRFSIANEILNEDGYTGLYAKVYDAKSNTLIKEVPIDMNGYLNDVEIEISGIDSVKVEVRYETDVFSGKHSEFKIVLGNIQFK